MTTGKRVISVLRVSTDEQDLSRQRTDVEGVVAMHGLEVVRTLELDGVSGRRVRQDPQFNAMLADLKRPDIAGVVVSAMDRLYRLDRYEDIGVLDNFKDARKVVYSAREGLLDPSTQMGLMVSLMSGAQSGLEWRELRRRTIQGKNELRRRGYHVSGSISLPRGLTYYRPPKEPGKTRPPGYWSYDTEEVARIRHAYDLLFQGVSWREIARQIGGGWSSFGILRSLKNPIWMGQRVYLPQPNEPEGREEILSVELKDIEPVLSPERWQQAQQLIAARHNRWQKTRPASTPFLVPGLVRCHCGEPVHTRTDYRNPQKPHSKSGRKHGKQHHTYFCRSRRHGPACGEPAYWQEVVDAAVERLVSEVLLDVKLLRLIVTEQQKREPPPQDRRKIKRELERLERKADSYIEDKSDGHLTREQLAKKLAEVDRQRQELLAQMPPEEETVNALKLIEKVASAFAEFSHLQTEQKRELLRSTISSLTIGAQVLSAVTLSGNFLQSLRYTHLSTPSSAF